MTWQISIEIIKRKSPDLEEIIDLAQRTASLVILTEPKVVFQYKADKATDLDVMIDRLWGWKTATFFLDGHAFRPAFLRMVLNCYLFKGMKNTDISSSCWLCPAHGDCEREVGRKIDGIFINKKTREG